MPRIETQPKYLAGAFVKIGAAVTLSCGLISAHAAYTTNLENQALAKIDAEEEALFSSYEAYHSKKALKATLALASAKAEQWAVDLELTTDPSYGANTELFAASGADDVHALFVSDKIEFAAARDKERMCLAQAIYYEARAESHIGQLAVADVIYNRQQSRLYPDSICGVVFQGSERVTGCQFSFTCDGSMDKPLHQSAWKRSYETATASLSGIHENVSNNATHYHADYVSPYWAPNLVATTDVGVHKFYRFPTRDEKRERAAAAAQ